MRCPEQRTDISGRRDPTMARSLTDAEREQFVYTRDRCDSQVVRMRPSPRRAGGRLTTKRRPRTRPPPHRRPVTAGWCCPRPAVRGVHAPVTIAHRQHAPPRRVSFPDADDQDRTSPVAARTEVSTAGRPAIQAGRFHHVVPGQGVDGEPSGRLASRAGDVALCRPGQDDSPRSGASDRYSRIRRVPLTAHPLLLAVASGRQAEVEVRHGPCLDRSLTVMVSAPPRACG